MGIWSQSSEKGRRRDSSRRSVALGHAHQMKFGKLFADGIADCSDWDDVGVRFKMLKKQLKQQVKDHRAREATTLFMKRLREDVRGLNAFWAAKEAELLSDKAQENLDLQHDVQRLLRFLILNYLCVKKEPNPPWPPCLSLSLILTLSACIRITHF